jgi:hypothetical protein
MATNLSKKDIEHIINGVLKGIKTQFPLLLPLNSPIQSKLNYKPR